MPHAPDILIWDADFMGSNCQKLDELKRLPSLDIMSHTKSYPYAPAWLHPLTAWLSPHDQTNACPWELSRPNRLNTPLTLPVAAAVRIGHTQSPC